MITKDPTFLNGLDSIVDQVWWGVGPTKRANLADAGYGLSLLRCLLVCFLSGARATLAADWWAD